MKFTSERKPTLKAGKHTVNAVSLYIEAELDDDGVVLLDAQGDYIPTVAYLNFAEECANAKFTMIDVVGAKGTFPGAQGMAEFKDMLCELMGVGVTVDIPAFENYPVKCKMTGKLNESKDGQYLNWANASLKAVQE